MSDESEENGVGYAQQECSSVLKMTQHSVCNGVEREGLVSDENSLVPVCKDQCGHDCKKNGIYRVFFLEVKGISVLSFMKSSVFMNCKVIMNINSFMSFVRYHEMTIDDENCFVLLDSKRKFKHCPPNITSIEVSFTQTCNFVNILIWPN